MENYNQQVVEEAVRTILSQIEVSRPGIENTPKRVAKMFKELFEGYTQDRDELVNGAIYSTKSNSIVISKDNRFVSTCEHHMLPFVGTAKVAYVPNGKIIGLSKIPRIINMYARRLQVQERLTRQIAEAIMDVTGAKGVYVELEGTHSCASIRGVKQENMRMKTVEWMGEAFTDPMNRIEVTQLLQ